MLFVSSLCSRSCAGIALAAMAAGVAVAQDARIWRCGSEYTNRPPASSGQGCQLVNSAAVTVIEGTRTLGPRANASAPASAVRGEKIEAQTQRQRDQDARAVLQDELQRARQQHENLLRAWNGGEPARRADEAGDATRYRERVAQLKLALQRSEADVAGLQRELSRLDGAAP